MLLHETGSLPIFYFPHEGDVRRGAARALGEGDGRLAGEGHGALLVDQRIGERG